MVINDEIPLTDFKCMKNSFRMVTIWKVAFCTHTSMSYFWLMTEAYEQS